MTFLFPGVAGAAATAADADGSNNRCNACGCTTVYPHISNEIEAGFTTDVGCPEIVAASCARSAGGGCGGCTVSAFRFAYAVAVPG